eukprot:CAMPEP_0177581784 /NCGR_PEP_ID=MMETSP0419_2-20121207/2345_1 /TAXON_ID=582737 /ORGANISM="Tetraselmis sp., Strain GSL018" /LENGTH=479 /DNA_ID=CAMNT_0019070875 /DNA_START=307 /DNA_END=1747 /DNA_ORIENTATION=+
MCLQNTFVRGCSTSQNDTFRGESISTLHTQDQSEYLMKGLPSRAASRIESSERTVDGIESLIQATRSSPKYRSDFRFLQSFRPGNNAALRHNLDTSAAMFRNQAFSGEDKSIWMSAPDVNSGKAQALIAIHCEFLKLASGVRVPSRLTAVNDRLELLLEETSATSLSRAKGLPIPPAHEVLSKFRRNIQEKLLSFMDKQTVLVSHGLHQILEALRLQHTRLIDTSHLFFWGSYRPSLDTLCTHILANDPDSCHLLADISTCPTVRKAKMVMAVVKCLLSCTSLSRRTLAPPGDIALPDSLQDDPCCKVHRLPASATPWMVRSIFSEGSVKSVKLWTKGDGVCAKVSFRSLRQAEAEFEALHHIRVGIDNGGYLYKEMEGGVTGAQHPQSPPLLLLQGPSNTGGREPGPCGHNIPRGVAEAGPSDAFLNGKAATVVLPSAAAAQEAFNSLGGSLGADSGGYRVKTLSNGVKVKWDMPQTP